MGIRAKYRDEKCISVKKKKNLDFWFWVPMTKEERKCLRRKKKEKVKELRRKIIN